jgi:hypothetical protein
VLISTNVISENYGAQWQGFPSTASGNGGGVAVVGGETIIRDNWIEGNWGTRADNIGQGGGIYTQGGEPQILDNTISGNYASANVFSFGGGVAISGSTALVQNNYIGSNVAAVDTIFSSGGEWGAGGGLYGLNATIQVLGNRIVSNMGADQDYGFGGGAYVEGSNIWFDRNTITHNDATLGSNGYGGALRITLGTVFTMTNNIVALNQADTEASGVAVLASSSGTLGHNTIVDNFDGDGAGIRVQSSSHVTLYNNIIATQTVGILNAGYPGSTVSATHTLFENNGSNHVGGVTSVFEIPGPARLRSDYRLRPGSNAIDQVSPLSWVVHDIDLDPRPVGTAADVGADEHALKAYLPIAFRNY